MKRKKNNNCKENIELLGSPKTENGYTFEDCLPYIEKAINMRRPRWLLNKVSWMDYSDVSQIIKIHFLQKWNQWDQSRPFANWCQTIITNQTINVVKNVYKNAASPCVDCGANEGNGHCRIYTTQCEQCPLYAKWIKGRAKKHAIQMAESYEEVKEQYKAEITQQDTKEVDINHIHKLVKQSLNMFQARVYDMMYIQHMEDDDIAKELGYITTEASRKRGYKSMLKLKKIFLQKAKEVIKNNDIIY